MSARAGVILAFVTLLLGAGLGAFGMHLWTTRETAEPEPSPSPVALAEAPIEEAENYDTDASQDMTARDEHFDMREAMVIRALAGDHVEGDVEAPIADAFRAVRGAWDFHEESLREAADPQKYQSDLRSRVAAAWANHDLSQLTGMGELLFRYDLGAWTPPDRTLRRVHRGAFGGPDAFRCASCHWVPIRGGGGALADNTFFDGDGVSTTSALVRNPPALFGAGLVQLVAAEMTRDLQAQVQSAIDAAPQTSEPQTVALSSKGVSFGNVLVHPNGFVDTTGVEGVDPDLVVRPFGWKGTSAGVRESIVDALGLQLGLSESDVGEPIVRALQAYIVTLDIPASVPPWLPDQQLRWQTGGDRFTEIGCAQCHRPYLTLDDATYRMGDVEIDLAALHHLDKDPETGAWRVWLYSDLKRHDMGESLRDHHNFADVAREQFQTPALWGVDTTAPYLHDGRGMDSFDATIAAHTGEGAASAEQFLKADSPTQAEIRVFLRTLSRTPQMRVLGP